MTPQQSDRPKIAVHKFSSCDGCQLAFLNLGEGLLQLSERVAVVHFAEAGYLDEEAEVDIAFVEGSLSTPEEVRRIHRIREKSGYLISIGACATSGGLQALRNMADAGEWIAGVYASPEYITNLDRSSPIASEVKVDLELWGCPVNSTQVVTAIRSLLLGVAPVVMDEKLCMDCKRRGNACVMVTHGEPCMGAVTRAGCGAICPAVGRGCYGCFGPSENPNGDSLASRMQGLGLLPLEISRRFLQINSAAPAFNEAGRKWQGQGDE